MHELLTLIALLVMPVVPEPGAAPTSQAVRQADQADQTTWTASVTHLARVEQWSFFEPPPGGGDPDSTFLGQRLTAQLARSGARFDAAVAAQYVGLFGLPSNASGPGALGTGALYFAQSDRKTHPQHVNLKYAHVTFKSRDASLQLRLGRQAYASGIEHAAGDARLNALERQRLHSRLVGEFEWSLFQRSFDGARVDWRRAGASVTGAILMPTQGGFARRAHVTMTDVLVSTFAASTTVGGADRPTHLQAFALGYRDRRDVTGRPDNTGAAATRADVSMLTIGGAGTSRLTTPAGDVDLLGWLAVQRGGWYGDDHRAVSFAGEAGFQWTGAPGTPWLRGGVLHASGDDDATDDRHGTFFPMVPTMRRFVQTAAYATLNLDDAFVQLQVAPAPDVSLRIEAHRLRLASAADRWYAGSGATTATGTFGYAGRPSGGHRGLGTSVEASAVWRVSSRFEVNGFLGVLAGGPVVRHTFAGDRLWFAYVEHVLRWQTN